MNINDLFARKKPVRRKSSGLTPEQAMANRALYEQEIEPMGDGANVYFQEFSINQKMRRWLLPGGIETWRDLDDEQVNYVLTYLEYFKSQIRPIHERYTEQLPGL